jgi:1-acyl-sn-glycerol-3-phosphate acyltransferase
MNLSHRLLRAFGWTVHVSVPDYDKSIICVAPHTSNYDFILCKLAYAAIGRHAGFLMKKSWFFWPLGSIFRAMGGVAVDRSRSTSLTDTLIERMRSATKLNIAITPEGTRSLTEHWRTGFLRVAMGANVPITLAVIDYRDKRIFMDETFTPTGDVDADMAAIKQYYSQFHAKYPEKFSTR